MVFPQLCLHVPVSVLLICACVYVHVYVYVCVCAPGAENCLEGLTFVITGVLDSLEREDAAELVKSYAGKVTNSVSGRTSYMVTGEGAGESKLAKVRSLCVVCMCD